MASTSDNRSEMMFLGKECQHPACHLHDFLPFSCPACHQTYCQPHFLPSQHSCQSPLPPSMVDRIAPTCPLCHEVVPTPKSNEPNEAVERHITSGTCVALEGGEDKKKAELKRRKEKGEVCFRRGCTKVLVVPMVCPSCKHQFCPSHRHASSHTCSPGGSPSGSTGVSRTSTPQPSASSSKPAPTAKSAISRLIPTPSSKPPSSQPQPIAPSPAHINPITAQLDARTAAAAAALKRAGQDAKAPFVKSKVDKANAEANSQLQALKVRHEKGLLTKAEEVKYAELVGSKESGRRKGEKGKGKDKDCVIA